MQQIVSADTFFSQSIRPVNPAIEHFAGTRRLNGLAKQYYYPADIALKVRDLYLIWQNLYDASRVFQRKRGLED